MTEELPKKVVKKAAKKVAPKKPEVVIPCGECKSKNICKVQGWCKHG
jgi:hypothetical protein